ncbi:hypothetical protein [Streptomyces sp. NPDC088400]|uniref:hypothetical protein n=1 Tax=Streptomyces sp. NPDC088400 TaxID=3365861 RepID=UPI00380ED7A0
MPGIDACLKEAMSLPGARGAAIVDWTSGLALGTAGESPNGDHEATAAETAELARAAAEYTAFAPVATVRTTATAAMAAARAAETATAQRPVGGETGGTGNTSGTSTSGAPGTPGAPTASATSAAPGTDSAGRDKGPPVEDLIVTTRTGYHILSFVETTFDSSVFLHLWLDRDTGNLALARLRLGQLAERLVLG